MNAIRRAAGAGALAVALAVVGAACASARYARMAPPEGASALGLEFGADRATAEATLRAASVAVRAAPEDADALVADRCPAAPVAAPCRLVFGPRGLYAVELEVPPADADALASAVEKGLGAPDPRADPAPAAEGVPALVAGWHRPGWTVTVSRTAPHVKPAAAVLRVEHDPAAPPVVAGVPLGRVREDVEGALERQGAILVQRDAGATTYLGCPQGAHEALSCVVLFRGGRAAAVTEVHPAAGDDRAALSAWQALAKRFERDIGRAPQTSCPDDGPDRIEGDCTATWASDRLVVVVGAHRSAGASHRGVISVYTSFAYPPLAAPSGEEDGGEPR